MIEFEYLTNPEKYHTVPPRLEGENDEQYKARLKAYVQGVESQQAKIDELQKRIDEVLKTCNNLRTDLIRENHVEYDKGWKDCATIIYHQLKGNKDD